MLPNKGISNSVKISSSEKPEVFRRTLTMLKQISGEIISAADSEKKLSAG